MTLGRVAQAADHLPSPAVPELEQFERLGLHHAGAVPVTRNRRAGRSHRPAASSKRLIRREGPTRTPRSRVID
jgi:hypothetical protein